MSNTGWSVAITSGAPAATIKSFLAAAASGRPNTGAETKCCPLGGGTCEPFGKPNTDRAHGDMGGAGRKRIEDARLGDARIDDAVLGENDGFHRGIVRQHGDDGLAACGLSRRIRIHSAGAHKRFGLGSGAIMHSQDVRGLKQIGCHGASHTAESNEADLHRLASFVDNGLAAQKVQVSIRSPGSNSSCGSGSGRRRYSRCARSAGSRPISFCRFARSINWSAWRRSSSATIGGFVVRVETTLTRLPLNCRASVSYTHLTLPTIYS